MIHIKHVFWLLLLISNLACSQQWQAQSSDKQLAVLELFTSEGCGLCPAADRWVQALVSSGEMDNKLIVLGFHIDYLNDKKGWVDKFAQPEFSDRQRQLARLDLYQSVYTPEFIISGEVVHNWQRHAKRVMQAVNEFQPEASLSLRAEQKGRQISIKTHVNVQGEENRLYSKLYIAITENNIISEVKGGDNAGAHFNHQHLVRKWLGPFDLDKKGKTDVDTEVLLDEKWNIDQVSLVAIVQNLNDGFVLQGLELPLK
jgi:hypothetical protein